MWKDKWRKGWEKEVDGPLRSSQNEKRTEMRKHKWRKGWEKEKKEQKEKDSPLISTLKQQTEKRVKIALSPQPTQSKGKAGSPSSQEEKRKKKCIRGEQKMNY